MKPEPPAIKTFMLNSPLCYNRAYYGGLYAGACIGTKREF